MVPQHLPPAPHRAPIAGGNKQVIKGLAVEGVSVYAIVRPEEVCRSGLERRIPNMKQPKPLHPLVEAIKVSKQPQPQQQPPLAYTIPEAVKVSRIGRTRLYEAIKDGSLRAKKLGRTTLILPDDLARYLQDLPRYMPTHNPSLRNSPGVAE
jgi:excisionase family DNA binding protein